MAPCQSVMEKIVDPSAKEETDLEYSALANSQITGERIYISPQNVH
jgi:hypothetical protein